MYIADFYGRTTHLDHNFLGDQQFKLITLLDIALLSKINAYIPFFFLGKIGRDRAAPLNASVTPSVSTNLRICSGPVDKMNVNETKSLQ